MNDANHAHTDDDPDLGDEANPAHARRAIARRAPGSALDTTALDTTPAPTGRATLRAVGQIALAIMLVHGLVTMAADLSRCVDGAVLGDKANTMICGWLFDPDGLNLAFTLNDLATTVLAAVGLWATLRGGRAWLAGVCAVLLASSGPAWMVHGLLTQPGIRALVDNYLWLWVTNLLQTVVPMVALLLSYRGGWRGGRAGWMDERVADEPTALGWAIGVLAPLSVLDLAVEAIELKWDIPATVPLPLPLIMTLAAGGLYGVMHRRRVPGAGPWLPATLILTALLVPNFTWMRWANPAVTDPVPGEITRATLAWALALTAVAVLGAAQLAAARRTPNRTHAATGTGASPTSTAMPTAASTAESALQPRLSPSGEAIDPDGRLGPAAAARPAASPCP